MELRAAWVLCVLCLWGVPVPCRSGEEADVVAMPQVIQQVRQDLQPLEVTQPPQSSTHLDTFYAYYGLTTDRAKHWLGTFESGPYRIAAHVFVPPESRATVVVAHGYYDHTGTWQHAIRHLVDRGFTVAIYDQPGHGLSSGKPASIAEFGEYAQVLRDFADLCAKHLEGPYHLAAHSMGCAAGIECLLHTDPPRVERVVLIAPLIRSAAWHLSGLGNRLGRKYLTSVPRKFRKNSSDDAYLAFVKKDPLHVRRVPLQWVEAHRRWVADIAGAESSEQEIKVIQGTVDSTVSWKYNVAFLRKKFPHADISLVEGGGHQLLNESEPLREETLRSMSAWLEAEE